MTKAARYIVAVAALLLIAFIMFLCGKTGGRGRSEKTDFHSCGSDSLTAYIAVEGGIYSRKGFAAGLQYALFDRFAEAYNYKSGIAGWCGKKDFYGLLADGAIDILIFDSSREGASGDCPAAAVTESVPVSGFRWAVREEDSELMRKINLWFGTFLRGREYRRLANKFLRSYNLDYYVETNTLTDRISPYDDIIKRQSAVLGWDWRLLAAVIFKESRFSVTACSTRGAAGLMQVLPSTAKDYGVSNIFDPESNIKAGASHLDAIKSRYENMGLDSVNVIKFTLAAYNAGEARIEDCINFTLHQGEDSMDWETVAETISLMRFPEYYKKADYLKYGPFTGRETVSYVNDILAQYDEYLDSVK